MKYPATKIAHWSTGPVPVCDQHAKEIVALGKILGLHAPLTKLTEPCECSNCINENKEIV